MADEEDALASGMSNADQIVGSEMCTCPDGTCEWCEAVLPDDSPARAVDFSEWEEVGYIRDYGEPTGRVDPDLAAKLAEALEGCERCQGLGECGWCK